MLTMPTFKSDSRLQSLAARQQQPLSCRLLALPLLEQVLQHWACLPTRMWPCGQSL